MLNETGKMEKRDIFMWKYYPWRNAGIKMQYFRRPSNRHWRRRRHWAMRPHVFGRTGWHKVRQELTWSRRSHGGHRLKLWRANRCLDAQRAWENDLAFHGCHNGGNQHFWTEQWGADRSKGAYHLHIGGHASARRRHACIDFGGGRLYIHRCHNGDNQRWKILRPHRPRPRPRPKPKPMQVKMVTETFPEKMTWKIERTIKKKKKVICRGYGYTSWYAAFNTGCKLPKGHIYKVTCMDNNYREGWGGGYLKIGRKKICHNWQWGANKRAHTVTIRLKR